MHKSFWREMDFFFFDIFIDATKTTSKHSISIMHAYLTLIASNEQQARVLTLYLEDIRHALTATFNFLQCVSFSLRHIDKTQMEMKMRFPLNRLIRRFIFFSLSFSSASSLHTDDHLSIWSLSLDFYSNHRSNTLARRSMQLFPVESDTRLKPPKKGLNTRGKKINCDHCP